jgi:Flp pilus assembly protein TadG
MRYQIRAMTLRKRELGQAAVEFAMTVIFIVILIVGLLEIIMLLFAYNVISDSAKEGVRYAIVHGTLSSSCSGPGDPLNTTIACDASKAGVITAITNYGNDSGQRIATSEITITYTNPTGGSACSAPGCGVQVRVAHPYRPFFGLGWPSVTVDAAAKGTVTF